METRHPDSLSVPVAFAGALEQEQLTGARWILRFRPAAYLIWLVPTTLYAQMFAIAFAIGLPRLAS